MLTRSKKNTFAAAFATAAIVFIAFVSAYAQEAPTHDGTANITTSETTPVPGDHSDQVERMAPCCSQCDNICEKYGDTSAQCRNCESLCTPTCANGEGQDTSEPEDDLLQGSCATTAE